jgi:hypothetical protein
MFRFSFLLLLVGRVALFAAPMTPITEAEAFKLPTPERLAAIMSAAQREGWAAQVAPLRAAAERAYRHDQLTAAHAWFGLYRWSGVWGMNDNDYLPRWMDAVKTANVAHANMPRGYPTRRLPMGLGLQPDLQLWLLGNAAFTDQLFALLTPVDYLPGVFQTLNEIYFHDPEGFKTYANLALAMAVVYDVPAPPYWPHGQVPPTVLARKLPRAIDAFDWWTKQDREGRTYHRLTQLSPRDLKFVVDAAAPFAELEWTQQVANYPLNSLSRAYTMVRYDIDRVRRDDLIWREKTYTLDDILAAGGICVDQAYFAAQVGKARGVPTLLFRGEGNDSRHAWFGFLDAKEKWQLDVGRYAEQRFVTGYAVDPQTWRQISDHELKFLSERFYATPAFQASRIHADFAADFLGSGNAVAAANAARKGIAVERRNLSAWEVFLAAEKALDRPALEQEGTLREAQEVFAAYPDLEVAYAARLSESLRARGDAAAADAEQSRVAQKFQSNNRGDINLASARKALVQSFTTQPLAEQIRIYNTAVTTQGKGAGVPFFDQVVLVFVEHLLQLQQLGEAEKAVELARQNLKVDANSLLQRDFEKLSRRLKTPE